MCTFLVMSQSVFHQVTKHVLSAFMPKCMHRIACTKSDTHCRSVASDHHVPAAPSLLPHHTSMHGCLVSCHAQMHAGLCMHWKWQVSQVSCSPANHQSLHQHLCRHTIVVDRMSPQSQEHRNAPCHMCTFFAALCAYLFCIVLVLLAHKPYIRLCLQKYMWGLALQATHAHSGMVTAHRI